MGVPASRGLICQWIRVWGRAPVHLMAEVSRGEAEGQVRFPGCHPVPSVLL